MKKTKRIALLLTVLLLAVMCFIVTASAEDEYFTEGDYTYFIKNEEIHITQIRSDETETLYIPDNLAGYPVTHVKMEFENCKMKSIVIPDSVTYISGSSWQSNNPDNAKTLIIGSGVQYIDDNVFSKWVSLEKITVSEDNKYFVTDENGILYNREMTRLVCFPLACEISEYDMPDTVNDCYTGFNYSKYLEKVTISDSLEYFPQFSNSEKLREVVISDSVVGITKEYLQNCKKLEKVTFGNSVSYIGEGAFRGCESLKKIVLPASITSVGKSAFSGCTSLSEVEIVGNIKEIKDWTFEDCKALEKITLPSTVKAIGKGAFFECPVQTVVFGGTQEGFNAIEVNNDGKYNQSFIDADVSCLPLSATKKIVSTATASSITITWDAVNGADGYKVYYKVANGWKALGNTVNTSATFTNLKSGARVTFAVRAGKLVDGKVVWADTYTTHETATQAVAPSKIVAVQSTNAIRLTWTPCPGATGYRIYYKLPSDEFWKVSVSTTGSTTHTYLKLKAGSKYDFAIRPYIQTTDAVIWSAYTTYTAATKPAAPDVSLLSRYPGEISVSWRSINGADGYQLYYKLNNSSSYKLYKTYTYAQMNLMFRNLNSADKYTFAIRAGIRTSGGVIWSDYVPKTISVMTRSEDFFRAVKQKNFVLSYSIEKTPVLMAMKGSNRLCIMGYDSEGYVFRMVYNKDGDYWYYIYDDIGAYTIIYDDELSGSAEDILDIAPGSISNTKLKGSKTQINGKTYFVETFTVDGETTKLYFDTEDNLVRIDATDAYGDTTVITVYEFLTSASSDYFVIPSNYQYVES